MTRTAPRFDDIQDGCDYHDHCLTCPLPICRYDCPGGLVTLLNMMRQKAERAARATRFWAGWDSASAIIAQEAQRFGTTPDAIIGPSRIPNDVRARDQAARRLRATGLPLKSIGLKLGGRDHTTIISALRRAGNGSGP